MVESIRKSAFRLGMIAAAGMMLGRDEVPTTAEACVACVNPQSCVSVEGGVSLCIFPNGVCRPYGNICS
jgi:hypothetical protein